MKVRDFLPLIDDEANITLYNFNDDKRLWDGRLFSSCPIEYLNATINFIQAETYNMDLYYYIYITL